MELTSNSFANSFRFLAAELRDLRKMQGSDLNNGKPSDALMEFSALMFRLNTLVVDAEGLLPTTLSSWLADKRKERAEGGGNVWELCFHEFESLVGYDPADAAITWEEPGYLNDDGHWYGSRRSFELTPGPIADLLPGVFLPIDGTVYGDGKLLDSARELYGNSYYKILGYMAVACDVLGKCVENRAAQGDDDTPTIPWNWQDYQKWAAAVVEIQLDSRFEFALLSLANRWADLLCFDSDDTDKLGKLVRRERVDLA